MKKILLLLFAFCCFSAFASLQDAFTTDENSHLFYKGRRCVCPGCQDLDNPYVISYSSSDEVMLFCEPCDIYLPYSESVLDDYAWGVSDNQNLEWDGTSSCNPFLLPDQVSPDAVYHGTKNISFGGGSSSGQGQNDSGEGGNTQGQGGGDDPSLIPEIFSFSRIVDVCVIGFSSFLGVCLGGFVIFLVIRRFLSKMKMLDGSSSETSTSDRPEK